MAKDEIEDFDLDDIGDLEDLDLDDDSLDLDDMDMGDISSDTDLSSETGSDDLMLEDNDDLSDIGDDLGEDFSMDDVSLDTDLADDDDSLGEDIEPDLTDADGGLDLSALEDELDLGEDDVVTAPNVEQIKDVNSDDELEKELASLSGGDDITTDADDSGLDMDLDIDDLGDSEISSPEDDMSLDDLDITDDSDSGLDLDADMDDLDMSGESDSELDLDADMDDLNVADEVDLAEMDISSDDSDDLSDLDGDLDLGESDDSLDTAESELGFDIDEPLDDSNESELIDDGDALGIDEDDALGEAMSVDMDDIDDPMTDDSMVLDASMEVKETDMQDLSESTDEIALDEEDIGGMPSIMNATDDAFDEPMDSDLMMAEIDDSAEEVISLEDEEIDDISDLGMDSQFDDQMSLDDISEVEDINEPSNLMNLEMSDDFATPESALIQTKPSIQKESESKLIGNELLMNLPHELTVEIGKTSLKGEDITSLNYGSIIELDKQVGDPVDIVLGDKTIAKGEVVQINQNKLGIRVTRINF